MTMHQGMGMSDPGSVMKWISSSGSISCRVQANTYRVPHSPDSTTRYPAREDAIVLAILVSLLFSISTLGLDGQIKISLSHVSTHRAIAQLGHHRHCRLRLPVDGIW